MNSEDKRKIKIGIAIAAFTVVFFLALSNLKAVGNTVGFVMNLLSPFFFGACLAFVLNVLLRFFENKVFGRLKDNEKFKKVKRPLCLTLTLIIATGIVALLITFIVPQLIESVKTLVTNLPSYVESLQGFTNSILDKFGMSANFYEAVDGFVNNISSSITTYAKEYLPKVLQTTMNVTSGLMNTLMGIFIGVYMLATKESLIRNVKRVIYAFIPKKPADSFTHVYRVAMKRFNGFVTGQLTEAVIIGVLCFIGMKIFGMEYALLSSVIVGVTNIIPIIGPIIGTVPGALILLMISPMKAVWFVIFIIVLQQLESNLIYPRVVGESVGLPGLWVMLAVVVGGSLFGLPGIILGVPFLAVIYAILSEQTRFHLKKKGLTDDGTEITEKNVKQKKQETVNKSS